MSKRTRQVITAITILAAVVFAVIRLTGDSDGSTQNRSSAPSTTSRTRSDTPSTTAATGAERASALPTVSVDELPREGVAVLALIETEGPFPYRQDGGVFRNREGILPEHEAGYYREYTVETPGSSDRGARRIIVGARGERYYTDDHYSSFREIVAS